MIGDSQKRKDCVIEMSQVKITETVLRDAHQSLIATRMTTEEMLPILEAMDDVGYYSLEAWGGATFDACMRFLNEDPWERLRKIRARVKKTKLQMLFRGQNILGYRHYADDVVEYFVQKSIANGIDIIRIFDALNAAAESMRVRSDPIPIMHVLLTANAIIAALLSALYYFPTAALLKKKLNLA